MSSPLGTPPSWDTLLKTVWDTVGTMAGLPIIEPSTLSVQEVTLVPISKGRVKVVFLVEDTLSNKCSAPPSSAPPRSSFGRRGRKTLTSRS